MARTGSPHPLTLGSLAVVLLLPRLAPGQDRARPRLEVQAGVVAAQEATMQAGVGVHLAAGVYTRLAVVGAAGLAWPDDTRRLTARVDGVVRFHLDPLRESRLGLYGLAGVSAMDDGVGPWEPRALVGLGVEGSRRTGWVPALELALGGGWRVTGVLRRPRPNRR